MSGQQEPRSKHRHDIALEKYKKARQEMHPGFKPTSRRSTKAASSVAAQYAEGSGSSSFDTDTDEFIVESREERKRKSTNRGLDDVHRFRVESREERKRKSTDIKLSSITKKGDIESASSPLVGFG